MQKKNVSDIISKFILIINLIKHTFYVIKRTKKYIYIEYLQIYLLYMIKK